MTDMAKDAYYFSHDSNARNDPKIIAMIEEFGMVSYAWYWVIIEIMREQDGYSIDLNSKFWMTSIAKQIDEDVPTTVSFLDSCVESFELFVKEGTVVYSPSLMARMEKFESMRDKARKAADARWGKRKPVEDVPFPEGEEKPKKKKDVGIDVIKNDSKFNDFSSELIDSGFHKEIIFSERSKFLDYLSAKGKKYKDYKAAFRNWLKSPYTTSVSKPSTGGKGMVY